MLFQIVILQQICGFARLLRKMRSLSYTCPRASCDTVSPLRALLYVQLQHFVLSSALPVPLTGSQGSRLPPLPTNTPVFAFMPHSSCPLLLFFLFGIWMHLELLRPNFNQLSDINSDYLFYKSVFQYLVSLSALRSFSLAWLDESQMR